MSLSLHLSFICVSVIFVAYDKKDGLTPEEEEERIIVKRKMLGNIKFIGELGKCGMLHESILHRCIQQVSCNE